MKALKANNSKQLDICLRLLYAEKHEFIVKVRETDNGKIYYEISVNTTEETMSVLEEKFRILIS